LLQQESLLRLSGVGQRPLSIASLVLLQRAFSFMEYILQRGTVPFSYFLAWKLGETP
jgi:hypothetical protein